MRLEFNPTKKTFYARLPRRTHLDKVQELTNEHGFEISQSASTPDTAVCFTNIPFAAVTFFDQATPEAKTILAPYQSEILASNNLTSTTRFRGDVGRDGKELWGFQRANLDYALRRKHVLVADQPGLGKTPTAIVYANEIRAKRVLVLCPASIRPQWVERIANWCNQRQWNDHIHCILNGKNGAHDGARWTVCSDDLARQPATHAALARSNYDLVILDEAHRLKTLTAKRTRAIFGGGDKVLSRPLAECAEHVLALTGTPLPNRPREAYVLARNLCFDAIDWMSEDDFKYRFNPSLQIDGERADGSSYFYIDEREGRAAELQNRLRYYFMTRHLKREAMPWLKLPEYDIIRLEPDGAIRAALKAESMLDIDPENLTGANAETLGQVSAVRKQMGVAMAPHVANYIDMLLEGGEEKLVVFAWHHEVLDILQVKFQKWGVRRIDGDVNTKRRKEIIDDFQTNPRCHVLIGNLISMGVGVDGLQDVCSHGLIAEPDWTPGNNQQAFDRLDRGTQAYTVQCDVFTVPGSFSEKVLAKSLKKNKVVHSTLDRRFSL